MPYVYRIETSAMKSPMKVLRECARRLLKEDVDGQRLRVFDFDDTLVKTDAKVYVTDKAGRRSTLTPGQFAVYDRKPGDKFDYMDFRKLINPREIKPMMRLLKRVYALHGACGVVVLSARSVARPIEQFMVAAGYPDVEVVALDDARPDVKANWISKRIARDDVKTLEFFDDSHKNVAAVKALKAKHPGARIHVHHVAHEQKRRIKRR